MPKLRSRAIVAAAIAIAIGATACTDNSKNTADTKKSDVGTEPIAAAKPITVESTDDRCDLSARTAPSGNVEFSVHNAGSQVTEFYLLRSDGKTIAAEVENIGPGLTRSLALRAQPGDYVATCKPGMSGDGIRVDFKVTKGASSVATSSVERS